MERAMGLEPTTFGLGSQRSTTELRPPCGSLSIPRGDGMQGLLDGERRREEGGGRR